MKRIHVDEIESVPALNGELQWKPVRHALGVDAFGINAYHGASAGDLVVEEHSDPHQELYVVVRGAARFRAGDEEFDAPAGTFVLFAPLEHRVAHASEPDTVVVAIGAEAERFAPSRWEYSFRAYGVWQLGRRDEAFAAMREGLEQYPDDPRLLYDLACLESLGGETDSAIEHLREVLKGNPELAERARADEDFDAIREDARFASLVAREPDSGGAGS
jgi:tetratricopeptide (TPR) repeat protein